MLPEGFLDETNVVYTKQTKEKPKGSYVMRLPQLPEACSSTLLSLLQTKQMASWRISQRKGEKKSELDLHIISHLMPVTSRNGPQKHGIPIQEIFKLTGLPVHLLCLKKKLFQLRTYAYQQATANSFCRMISNSEGTRLEDLLQNKSEEKAYG